MKRFLGTWLYTASIAGILGFAAQLSSLFAAFPLEHLSSYGPRLPAIVAMNAQWIPHAPALLCATALLSVLAGIWLWRSKLTPGERPFALVTLAAINLSVGLVIAGAVLACWFLLPKVANLA